MKEGVQHMKPIIYLQMNSSWKTGKVKCPKQTVLWSLEFHCVLYLSLMLWNSVSSIDNSLTDTFMPLMMPSHRHLCQFFLCIHSCTNSISHKHSSKSWFPWSYVTLKGNIQWREQSCSGRETGCMTQQISIWYLPGPTTIVFEYLTIINRFILTTFLWRREVLVPPFYGGGTQAQRN